jgi:ubiquinone/menaquinone biosynthesis C-methylase UbiE
MADRFADWLRTRRDGGSPLDVGCGDGLVGLGALERGARVIFSDVSDGCLADCRSIAGEVAEYRRASATDLGNLAADVVTTRSVLIYVEEKDRAFQEFFRVLRPGGRLSIFEPINRFGLEERRATFAAEQEQLTAVLRPQVEEGRGNTRLAHAFLTARKPA